MEQIKNSRTDGFLVLYDMQTTFFSSVIDGISENDTTNRLNTGANHIAWLTGSLVAQRYGLAKEFGVNKVQNGADFFAGNKGIQDNATYPTLDVYRRDWEIISPLLREAILNASAPQLDREIEMSPDFKMTAYDLLSFSVYREANIIGQIALWRRLLGYPAMKYM
ncbi:DinB family protein [Dyadobacter psychrotolerans]|uniref:DinB family protein n=1 Tax=Dyadobacter psychrotolerans TaxID=2541721 RepID=A0A4R5DTX7_9BACT|nr:DinB family protein [Dyadobacter psychrotolerans]TDE14615.1 DinB family protein [Dyadobacter psychrotolerans]